MRYKPHPYQLHATSHILDNDKCGLFIDMGLGKTVATATAIRELIYERLEVSRVLVIAPLRVADDTWTGELDKWDHLQGLRVSKVLGTEAQRKKALAVPADVYTINVENVAWLVAHYGGGFFPFDMVVIDESSKFKNQASIRFKALRAVRLLIKRVVLLSGTPSPNGYIDLWSQLYLLDGGARLGKTVGEYRRTYFNEGMKKGHVVYNYSLKKGYGWFIAEQIADVCISMKAKDYLDLPELVDNTITLKMRPDVAKKYKDFERQKVLELVGEDITAANAAALTNKLLQYANGAVYDEDRNVHVMHDTKLDALEEIIEAAVGKPVLVFYNYQHDRDRILKKLKSYGVRLFKDSRDLADWNNGTIPVFLVHPASAGHGLNMQHGGSTMVWYGLPWSLELYLQGKARLHRQGQTQTVVNNILVCAGTLDEDVVKALENKGDTQSALLDALKARIEKYRHGV